MATTTMNTKADMGMTPKNMVQICMYARVSVCVCARMYYIPAQCVPCMFVHAQAGLTAALTSASTFAVAAQPTSTATATATHADA